MAWNSKHVFLVIVATLGLLVGGLVGLTGCGDGNGYTSPPPNGDSTGEYISVAIESLIAQYQEDAAAADAKYKDKRIVISGAKTESGDTYVILDYIVRVEIKDPHGDTAEVMECAGRIEARGLCRGLSEGLVLVVDCLIREG